VVIIRYTPYRGCVKGEKRKKKREERKKKKIPLKGFN